MNVAICITFINTKSCFKLLKASSLDLWELTCLAGADAHLDHWGRTLPTCILSLCPQAMRQVLSLLTRVVVLYLFLLAFKLLEKRLPSSIPLFLPTNHLTLWANLECILSKLILKTLKLRIVVLIPAMQVLLQIPLLPQIGLELPIKRIVQLSQSIFLWAQATETWLLCFMLLSKDLYILSQTCVLQLFQLI